MNNSDKIILDLCGATGAFSKDYRGAGYDVRIITTPTCDVRTWMPPANVYGILAASPCTQFSWARSWTNDSRDMRQGMEIVKGCLRIVEICLHQAWEAKNIKSFKFWVLENPAKGYLSRFMGRPCFEFSPNEYGDPYTKPTALWGYFNIPKKTPIKAIHTNFAYDKALQKLPSEYKRPPDMLNNRACRRAMTPPGFAKAFFRANQ